VITSKGMAHNIPLSNKWPLPFHSSDYRADIPQDSYNNPPKTTKSPPIFHPVALPMGPVTKKIKPRVRRGASSCRAACLVVELAAAVVLVARVTAVRWGAALVERCHGGGTPWVREGRCAAGPFVDIMEERERLEQSSSPRDTVRRHWPGCRPQIGSCSV
jgi:hypothetical protein